MNENLMISLKDTFSLLSGKKFLITGANGMLGTSFQEVLNEYVPNCKILNLDKKQLDITNKENVLSFVDEKPDFILHCASKSCVDCCEEEPDDSHKILVEGTSNISLLAKLTGAKLFYPQSFLIFDGETLPITEETLPNPLCTYGKHKYESELILLRELSNPLIVRMAGFFGGLAKDKNFVGKILPEIHRRITENQSTIEIGDRVWQPTYTNDLALNVLILLAKEKYGIYTMASHSKASFFELTTKIVSFLNLENKIKVICVDSRQFSKKEKAKRPLLALMENKRLQQENLDYQRTLDESLKEYLSNNYFKQLLG